METALNKEIEMPAITQTELHADAPSHTISFLSEIELQASVEIGRVNLTIGEVLRLSPGSVVQLDKIVGEPVELIIKDKLIAKGEVVVVDEKFGLRILEIVANKAL